jgi:hypothetical protein
MATTNRKHPAADEFRRALADAASAEPGRVADALIAAGWDGSGIDYVIPPKCPVCGEQLGGVLLCSVAGEGEQRQIIPLVYCEDHCRAVAAELLERAPEVASGAEADELLGQLFEG